MLDKCVCPTRGADWINRSSTEKLLFHVMMPDHSVNHGGVGVFKCLEATIHEDQAGPSIQIRKTVFGDRSHSCWLQFDF